MSELKKIPYVPYMPTQRSIDTNIHIAGGFVNTNTQMTCNDEIMVRLNSTSSQFRQDIIRAINMTSVRPLLMAGAIQGILSNPTMCNPEHGGLSHQTLEEAEWLINDVIARWFSDRS